MNNKSVYPIQKTIGSVIESMEKVEKERNLFEKKIGNDYMWPIIRYKTYYLINEKLGYFEPQSQLIKKRKRLNLVALMTKRIFKNPFVFKNKFNTIILEHPRSQDFNGKQIDIYTFDFHDNNTLLIDNPSPTQKSKSHEKYRSDILLLDLLCSLLTPALTPFIIRNNENEEISEIERALSTFFNTNLDIKKTIQKELVRFFILKAMFKSLFYLKKCKKLIVTVSYDNIFAIAAAKELKMEVDEVQHGTLGRYHIGYNIPSNKFSNKYLPNRFYLWSNFWKEQLPLDIPENNKIVYKNSYFENRLHKYRNIKTIKNKIIVLSQGALGNKIALAIETNKKKLKNFEIFYKLHPGEYTKWQSYPDLLKLTQLKQFHLLLDCDLAYHLKSAEYQIGVFSTAIYEGIELGTKTVLLDLPGIEYMSSLIHSNEAQLFEKFLIEIDNDD